MMEGLSGRDSVSASLRENILPNSPIKLINSKMSRIRGDGMLLAVTQGAMMNGPPVPEAPYASRNSGP